MKEQTSSQDIARLLPRFRDAEATVARHELERGQASALMGALAEEPTGRALPSVRVVKAEAGDLRGIPVIGRGVGGASPGSSPESAVGRLDRERERRERADGPVEPMVGYA